MNSNNSFESPLSALPSSTSSTLHLTPATPSEKELIWHLNGGAWRGPFSISTYLRREHHLGSQPLTLNGGITYWVLTDSALDSQNALTNGEKPSHPSEPLTNGNNSSNPPRIILASCETLRKRALVAHAPSSPSSSSHVEDVIAHGVGSVFCRFEFRKRGYAGRMMRELGKNLETHQQSAGKTAAFTVLYSDIGKQFYAREGWKAFPSGHISLLPTRKRSNRDTGEVNGDGMNSGVRDLVAEDLKELCEVDEKLLRERIRRFKAGETKARVALIPDADTMQWHHAREEFAAKELLGRAVDVKGAIVEAGEGKRVWAIWTRTFAEKAENSTLHILRMVVEGEKKFEAEVGTEEEMGRMEDLEESNVSAAAAVLRAAQREAGRWPMHAVEVWNPSHTILAAARTIQPDAKFVERESQSITSLMWYGDVTGDDNGVEWVGNEKYGWC